MLAFEVISITGQKFMCNFIFFYNDQIKTGIVIMKELKLIEF